MTDTAPANAGAPDSAPGAELQIPKHRFDEILSKVARLQEEVDIKNRLINETQQRMLQQQQPQRSQELNPDDFGLDAQTFKSVSKLAEVIADRRVAGEKAVFEQQIGMLASRTEKAELLAARGADKEKYLPEIQRRQQEHYRNTGGFIPAEMALKLIQADESEKRIRDLEAKLAGKPVTESNVAPETQASGPGVGGTREMPNAGVTTTQKKSFGEQSVEEMERTLQEQFEKGTVL